MNHRSLRLIVLLVGLTLSAPGFAQDSLGVSLLSSISNVWGQPGKCAYNDSFVYIPTGITGLRIIDIRNIHRPREVGYFDTEGNAVWADVVGNLCYVADELRGIRIIDVSDPVVPVEVGFYDTPHLAKAVIVRDVLAYVADNSGGLRIIDVHDPTATQQIGQRDTDGPTVSLALSGNYCYLSDVGLRVIDVSNIYEPREIVHIQTPGAGRDLAVEGNFCYFADGVMGVKVYDISEPAAPNQVGSLRTATAAVGISVFNRRMYVAAYLGCFRVISAEDSSKLSEVGRYLTYGLSYTVQAMGNIALLSDGFSLYILDCSGAMSAPVIPLNDQPATFTLSSPYPNPFNGSSSISYSLTHPATVELGIYDPRGNLVMNLASGLQAAGDHRAIWKSDGYPTGLYFARLQTEGGSQSQRMVLVK